MNKELSKMDVVLFALYQLNGVSKKVHTEEIAWSAYQLDKGKFSWCLPKYIEKGFPDKLTALIALETAHKEKYGRLVVGRAGRDVSKRLDGWQFTADGVKWIKDNENRILNGLNKDRKSIGMQKRDAKRFIKKIKSEQFYKYFQENKNLDKASLYMLTDLLVCAPDASQDIIKQKFDKIYNNAQLVNDDDILSFLKVCKEKFIDLLR